jgi:hypothetical protein
MTGSPPGPAHLAGKPGPDERTAKPVLTLRNRPHRTVTAAHIVVDHGAGLKALRPLRGRAPPEP